jgi:hypothetical protein
MLAYIFVIAAFAFRFLRHSWGFTPVGASLLFFGSRASRKQMWFPMALFALSDVILTKFVYSYPFTWDHFVTWAWYAAILALGTRLRDHAKPVWIIASALASSVSFFLVSNFAAWACYTDLYPRSWSGIMASFVAGIPFFQRDVVGTLLFTAVMFSIPALAKLPKAAHGTSGPAAV